MAVPWKSASMEVCMDVPWRLHEGAMGAIKVCVDMRWRSHGSAVQ